MINIYLLSLVLINRYYEAKQIEGRGFHSQLKIRNFYYKINYIFNNEMLYETNFFNFSLK